MNNSRVHFEDYVFYLDDDDWNEELLALSWGTSLHKNLLRFPKSRLGELKSIISQYENNQLKD